MFAPGTYGSPPLNVIQEETSSIDEDPTHVVSELQPDSGVYETDAIQVVNPAPIDTHDCGVKKKVVRGADGRIVKEPYLDRDDIGSYGVYVGNWSGRRKLQVVNNHIAADLIARNPAQVLLAQEVDRTFIDHLLDPRSSSEVRSRPMKVGGRDSPAAAGNYYEDRETNMHPWVVAVAPEDNGTNSAALIVAARTTRAKASTVVELNRMFHREYKRKGKTHLTYSRLLVAQVEWKRPMHGQQAVQFLNVHFHHMAAKKDSATPLSSSLSLEGMSLCTKR